MPTTHYFKNFTDIAALTREWKRLAKLHHPDVGGSLATMQEINAEYDRAKKRLLAAPSQARAYTGPVRSPLDDMLDELYEKLHKQRVREELQRRQEQFNRQKEAAREEVKKQQTRWQLEVSWALVQLERMKYHGLLRGCRIAKGTRSGVNFIEVTGNSYPYRENLKRIGFRWNPESKLWYFFKKPLFVDEPEDDDDDNAEDYGYDEDIRPEDIPFPF